MSGIRETGDQGAEFIDGGSVFRVVDLVGPFVGIFGGVVEFLFFGPVTGVASEFVADANVGQVGFAFIAQASDGGTFPRRLRVFEQRDQRAPIDVRGWRESAEFGQRGIDI